MKKLFIAISFIIAISVIPVIYNAVDNAMTEKTSYTFTLTDFDVERGEGTYTSTLTLLELISKITYEDGIVLNVESIMLNNNPLDYDLVIYDDGTGYSILTISYDGDIMISLHELESFITDKSELLNVNDIITIVLTTKTNGLWSVLLSLIPLVFVAGITVYFVKKNDLNA